MVHLTLIHRIRLWVVESFYPTVHSAILAIQWNLTTTSTGCRTQNDRHGEGNYLRCQHVSQLLQFVIVLQSNSMRSTKWIFFSKLIHFRFIRSEVNHMEPKMDLLESLSQSIPLKSIFWGRPMQFALNTTTCCHSVLITDATQIRTYW